MEYTEEEILKSYKGRCLCEAEELGIGYCGSCSLECHKAQMAEPNSWGHSSFSRWMGRVSKVEVVANGMTRDEAIVKITKELFGSDNENIALTHNIMFEEQIEYDPDLEKFVEET